MSRYHLTPEAVQDLDDISDYLLQHHPASAARIVQRIHQTCQRLAQFPGMGRARDELQPGLLSFPCDQYVIYYRPAADGVEIVRILHGARDVSSLFQRP